MLAPRRSVATSNSARKYLHHGSSPPTSQVVGHTALQNNESRIDSWRTAWWIRGDHCTFETYTSERPENVNTLIAARKICPGLNQPLTAPRRKKALEACRGQRRCHPTPRMSEPEIHWSRALAMVGSSDESPDWKSDVPTIYKWFNRELSSHGNEEFCNSHPKETIQTPHFLDCQVCWKTDSDVMRVPKTLVTSNWKPTNHSGSSSTHLLSKKKKTKDAQIWHKTIIK